MNKIFRRTLAFNPVKKLRIPLGEMSFVNDFTDISRGNMYPLITGGECDEKIENGIYSVSGEVRRLLGEHFFMAEYYISVLSLSGCAGVSLLNTVNDAVTDIFTEKCRCGYEIYYCSDGQKCKTGISLPENIQGFSVCCSGRFFEIYAHTNGVFSFKGRFEIPALDGVCAYPCRYKALLYVNGALNTDKVEFYLDNGVAFADMRPIRNKDLSLLTENGRVFFTMSSRRAEGGFQSVISWLPGSADFRLEGAIFFDCGDSVLTADVASSVIYDKGRGEFLLWMCAFSHGHICGWGKTDCDLRHGINIMDITLMPVKPGSGETEFFGLQADEDPDFYFDGEKWLLTLCRMRNIGKKRTYSYVRFVSSNPFTGYEYLDSTGSGGETGGSTVEVEGKKYFICGADMDATSEYRIYSAEDLSTYEKARFDYPDGGFRGWGTLVPFKRGSKEKLYWVTFDRVKGGTSNWSYGNLYVFEAE